MNLRYMILGAAAMAAQFTFAQFGAEQTMPQEGPRTVHVVDLDTDGDNDVLIASRSGLQSFINLDGLGTLTPPIMVDAADAVAYPVDANLDGYPDVASSGSLAGGIRWYAYTGTFAYGAAVTVDPIADAASITAGDVDGDGDDDLVMALGNNTIQWSRNTDGLGTYGPLSMLVYATQVVGLSVRDMDGDDDNDIAWTSEITSQANWAENTDGNGSFNGPILLSSEGRGCFADVDGDGRSDLVMIDTWTDQVLWQRRDRATVSFGPEQAIATGFDQPGAVLAADLDGDGDNDVVAASRATDQIVYFENIDGQGHFGPLQVVGTNVQDCDHLAAGDLDRDGDMELFANSGPQQRVVRFDNLANADGMITGRVFNDLENNGTFDGQDHGLYNVRVDVAGLGHTFTNHSGMYWFPASPGAHSVSVPAIGDWSFSTAATRNVNLGTGGSMDNDFGLYAAAANHQVNAVIGNAPTRCGTEIAYWITVENTGNQVDDLHLNLDLEDLNGLVSADPVPFTDAGGLQTWHFTDVQPTHQRTIALVVQLADASHMGEILHDQLVTQSWHDGSLVQTTTCNNDPVLDCAYDPNDKQVSPEGDGDANLTAMDAILTYTIRFQNTGTIPAIDVVIIDQLDTDLDPATVHFVSASHPVHMVVGDDGAITFTFEGIMLPDSGSDMAGSQGYVRFNVRALSGLPELTPVHNHAEIVFDANPAIITNTTTNTLTYGMTGVDDVMVIGDAFIHVQPNPAFDMATVHIGSGLTGRVTIDVFDEAGQKVIRLVRNTNTVIIHREDMPTGVYLLRATDENGREAMTRLVWGR